MRKGFKISIFFIMIWLFVLGVQTVFAVDIIAVTSNKNVIEEGEQVQITVNLKNTEVTSCTLEIYFDMTKLEYVDKTENSNLLQNRVIYTWTDKSGKNRTAEQTETFTFQAIQEGTASIVVTGECYNSQGNRMPMQDGSIEIIIGNDSMQVDEEMQANQTNDEETAKVSSDNSYLRVMRLNHEGISPEFQKDIYEYYFIADQSINQLDITAIPENSKSNVSMIGNTELKEGLNIIKIEVQSEDKTKKTIYQIRVTKTKNKELANSNLENLAVKEGMLYPPFDSNITKYQLEVPNDTKELTILAIPEKENGKVKIEGNQELKIGKNEITITVTAEDRKTVKKYRIEAYKRNEQEEVQAKEEEEKQAEQLTAILENEEKKEVEQNQNYQDNTNEEKMKTIDIITWVLVVAIIIGFGICVFRHFMLQ